MKEFQGITDVIFAPITGRGGSVSVIRISGDNFDNLKKAVASYKDLSDRKVILSDFLDFNGDFVDSALFTLFKAPNSFTGENVIEISLHGGEYVINRVCEILTNDCGYRFAKPGEFSKRAFLNGKMDIIEAEGINAIIKSQSKIEHSLAARMIKGEIGKIYRKWRERMISIISFYEIEIDFPEEDIETNVLSNAEKEIKQLKDEVVKHVEESELCKKQRKGFSVVVFGLPNVGKSSITNSISKEDISIVTNISGTTRDVIESSLNIAGISISLFDTAGIRTTDNPIESEGIKRAITKKEEADFGLVVLDASQDLNKQILELKNYLKKEDIIVVNKCDLIDLSKQLNWNTAEKEILDTIKNNKNTQDNSVFTVNTIDGNGISKLIRQIKSRLEQDFKSKSYDAVLSDRILDYLKKFIVSLESLTLNAPIEIIAEQLRNSVELISIAIGDIHTEDLLDSIFNKFCIGK